MPDFTNIVFETVLDTRREIDKVIRDGESVEAMLLADWSIKFRWQGKDWRLTVPKGFQAAPSVPKMFRHVASFWDGGFEGSVAHDWLYVTRAFDTRTKGEGRKAADQLYRAVMKAAEVPWRRRWRNYLAVRAGGGKPYRRHTYRAENGLVAL